MTKTGLPLMKDILKSLAKVSLVLLGLTAAASATDAAIHKKIRFIRFLDEIVQV